MKLFHIRQFYLCSLFLLLISLSSFSVHNFELKSKDDAPPISKKENRRQQRLEKRSKRLQKRLKNAKHIKQKQAIKKKLNVIKNKQNIPPRSLGIMGFIFSLVALLFFLVVLALLLVNLMTPIGFGLIISLLFLGMSSGVIGLVLSILSFITGKQNPDKENAQKLSLLGIIISSIVLGISLIFAILILLYH